MSLEQALQENTAAIRELIAHYKGNSSVSATPANVKSSDVGLCEKVRKQVDGEHTQPTAQTEAATYKQASDAILALVKECGRDSALKVISAAQEGAGKLPEVAAENWGKVIAGANAAIAAKKGAA